MKAISKKVISLLSGAVLLCSAGAMPANAAEVSASAMSSSVNLGTTLKTVSSKNFYLNYGDFVLADGGKAYNWVLQSSSYTLPANSTVSYQWYKDGTAISGATDYKYLITAAGTYYCKVKVRTTKRIKINDRYVTGFSTSTYDTNSSTVTEQFVMKSQTGDCTIDTNVGYADLKVTVKGGTAPYTYEWTRDGNSYANNNYIVAALYAGTYKCKVTDSKGRTVTSKPIKVSSVPFKITSQPKGGYICTNDGYYDMFVSVDGGIKPYTYKWTWNGKETSLTGSGMRVFGTGTAYCEITDARGNKVRTNTVNVTKNVFKIAKDITESSDREVLYDSTVCEYRATAVANSHDVTLSIKAAGGTGRYKYEWECTHWNGYSESWLPVGGGSNIITLRADDVYDSYTYYWSNYGSPYYGKNNYRKYRCKVSCLDDNGNVLSTITSGTVRVEAYDRYEFGGF